MDTETVKILIYLGVYLIISILFMFIFYRVFIDDLEEVYSKYLKLKEQHELAFKESGIKK